MNSVTKSINKSGSNKPKTNTKAVQKLSLQKLSAKVSAKVKKSMNEFISKNKKNGKFSAEMAFQSLTNMSGGNPFLCPRRPRVLSGS